MGEGSVEGSSTRKTPRSAKIIMILQSIVIIFLAYWAFEEYENNVYFQSYVNATVQANTLLIGGVVIGIPILMVLGLLARRRGGRSLDGQVSDSHRTGEPSLGSLRAAHSSEARAQNVSPLAAELSSRFLGRVTASPSSTPSQVVGQGRFGIAPKPSQPLPARSESVETGLRFLERVEPRQGRVEPSQEVQKYQAPRQFGDSELGREAGYRPAPSFPRRPDNPVIRRTPLSSPLVKPSTVVTGVMSQGTRQYNPPQAQGSILQGQRPVSQPDQEKWEPGVRPPGPLVSMPAKPPKPDSPSLTGTVSPLGADLASLTPSSLGRVGPAMSASNKTPGAESSPGINRVEPVQAVANKLPWPKNKPPDVENSGPSFSREQGSQLEDDSFSALFGGEKTGVSGKREEKRERPGENSGS